MVLSLIESNSSPTWSLPERNAAPVRGRSQIRTPRCWEGLCGSGVGSKTMPMGLRRVSRMRPEETAPLLLLVVVVVVVGLLTVLLLLLVAMAVAASGAVFGVAAVAGC